MSANEGRARLAGACLVAALSAAFTALYWNRFLAPSGGWTFYYLAEQLLAGRIPYRDIFFVVTPLEVFKLAAVIRIFGDTLAAVRLEAAVERTMLAVVLYLLLTRMVKIAPAAIASLLTVVILASDPADALVNYHIDSAFWATCAAACASFAIGKRARAKGAFFAGFFAALCLLTKQTTGAGVLIAIAFTGVVVAWRSGGVREAARFSVPYAGGASIPIASFAIWLVRTRALQPFLRTVFTTSSSKGSLAAVLSRPFTQLPWLFLAGAVVTLVLAQWVRTSPRTTFLQSPRALLLVACGGVMALALAMTGSHMTALRQSAEYLTIFIGLIGSALIFLRYGWTFFKAPLGEREQQIWMLSAASFATAYMLSLSWAVYSPMAAPGVGLVAALAADRVDGKRFWALSGAFLLLIYGSASGKLAQPFTWMYWMEPPVSQATHASSLPQLAGLRISEPTLSIAEQITAAVKGHTKPGDSLLVYPYLPVFYVLTGLNPPTYSFNHYIDVCPDPICRADAAAIAAHPPDAIVYLIETEQDRTKDEAVFRSGRRSGSRDVAEAIERIAAGYHKLLSKKIPGGEEIIEVYSRQ